MKDDDEAPEVEGIHVSRFENGNQPYCAHLFGPEELVDLEQIADLFGGGKYELVARAQNRISAKRRYELAGKPKPLSIGAVDAPDPTHTVPPHAPQAPQFDGGMGQMLMQFMAMQSQSNSQMMQMMMQSSQQTMTSITAMATAMVSRDGDGNKSVIQALQSANDKALQGQAQVFQTMLETLKGTGGKDLFDAYREGLSDAAGGGGDDAESGDGVMGTMKTAVEAMKLASELTGDGPPQTGEPIQ